MSEADKTTMTLITTSWQALQRAELKENFGLLTVSEKTKLCDCISTIVFATFFLEANLNCILDYMCEHGKSKKSSKDFGGLGSKLKFFYSEFVLKSQIETVEVIEKIDTMFLGFKKIYGFRNDVAHGRLDSIQPYEKIHDLNQLFIEVENLRNLTKKIVDWLFKIAKGEGCDIPRETNYKDVIDNYVNNAEQINIGKNVPYSDVVYIIPMIDSSS